VATPLSRYQPTRYYKIAEHKPTSIS
jgi:hypothetical protein